MDVKKSKKNLKFTTIAWIMAAMLLIIIIPGEYRSVDIRRIAGSYPEPRIQLKQNHLRLSFGT